MIEFISCEEPSQVDVVVFPCWQGEEGALPAAELGSARPFFERAVASQDFKGKGGEILCSYSTADKPLRWMLLGLGKLPPTPESLRRASAALASYCLKKGWQSAALQGLCLQGSGLSAELEQAFLEGLCLSTYRFDRYKSEKEPQGLCRVEFVGFAKPLDRVLGAQIAAEATHLARDLVNQNADEVTPRYLADLALQWSRQLPSIKTTIWDRSQLEVEGLELFLAVARGAATDPYLISMEYQGSPADSHTVIVGKGLTFDTGGLNLKVSGMETMRCDMGGAAAAFGALWAAARLGLKGKITVIVASCENAIGSRSYKVGDVYRSFSGKTVEITNTDAEGRLTMADALAWAAKRYRPSRLIDIATLTGAAEIALGTDVAALMGNDDSLVQALQQAGQVTYERVWPLPLFEEYKDALRSDVADLKNWGGRAGGAIVAGAFLAEFVGNTPWAHLDIAGPAFLAKEQRYLPKNGTGFGVRLLLNYLQSVH